MAAQQRSNNLTFPLSPGHERSRRLSSFSVSGRSGRALADSDRQPSTTTLQSERTLQSSIHDHHRVRDRDRHPSVHITVDDPETATTDAALHLPQHRRVGSTVSVANSDSHTTGVGSRKVTGRGRGESPPQRPSDHSPSRPLELNAADLTEPRTPDTRPNSAAPESPGPTFSTTVPRSTTMRSETHSDHPVSAGGFLNTSAGAVRTPHVFVPGAGLRGPVSTDIAPPLRHPETPMAYCARIQHVTDTGQLLSPAVTTATCTKRARRKKIAEFEARNAASIERKNAVLQQWRENSAPIPRIGDVQFVPQEDVPTTPAFSHGQSPRIENGQTPDGFSASCFRKDLPGPVSPRAAEYAKAKAERLATGSEKLSRAVYGVSHLQKQLLEHVHGAPPTADDSGPPRPGSQRGVKPSTPGAAKGRPGSASSSRGSRPTSAPRMRMAGSSSSRPPSAGAARPTSSSAKKMLPRPQTATTAKKSDRVGVTSSTSVRPSSAPASSAKPGRVGRANASSPVPMMALTPTSAAKRKKRTAATPDVLATSAITPKATTPGVKAETSISMSPGAVALTATPSAVGLQQSASMAANPSTASFGLGGGGLGGGPEDDESAPPPQPPPQRKRALSMAAGTNVTATGVTTDPGQQASSDLLLSEKRLTLTKLSVEQYFACRRVFCLMDDDGGGSVDLAELVAFQRANPKMLSKQVFGNIKLEGDTQLYFDEFIRIHFPLLTTDQIELYIELYESQLVNLDALNKETIDEIQDTFRTASENAAVSVHETWTQQQQKLLSNFKCRSRLELLALATATDSATSQAYDAAFTKWVMSSPEPNMLPPKAVAPLAFSGVEDDASRRLSHFAKQQHQAKKLSVYERKQIKEQERLALEAKKKREEARNDPFQDSIHSTGGRANIPPIGLKFEREKRIGKTNLGDFDTTMQPGSGRAAAGTASGRQRRVSDSFDHSSLAFGNSGEYGSAPFGTSPAMHTPMETAREYGGAGAGTDYSIDRVSAQTVLQDDIHSAFAERQRASLRQRTSLSSPSPATFDADRTADRTSPRFNNSMGRSTRVFRGSSVSPTAAALRDRRSPRAAATPGTSPTLASAALSDELSVAGDPHPDAPFTTLLALHTYWAAQMGNPAEIVNIMRVRGIYLRADPLRLLDAPPPPQEPPQDPVYIYERVPDRGGSSSPSPSGRAQSSTPHGADQSVRVDDGRTPRGMLHVSINSPIASRTAMSPRPRTRATTAVASGGGGGTTPYRSRAAAALSNALTAATVALGARSGASAGRGLSLSPRSKRGGGGDVTNLGKRADDKRPFGGSSLPGRLGGRAAASVEGGSDSLLEGGGVQRVLLDSYKKDMTWAFVLSECTTRRKIVAAKGAAAACDLASRIATQELGIDPRFVTPSGHVDMTRLSALQVERKFAHRRSSAFLPSEFLPNAARTDAAGGTSRTPAAQAHSATGHFPKALLAATVVSQSQFTRLAAGYFLIEQDGLAVDTFDVRQREANRALQWTRHFPLTGSIEQLFADHLQKEVRRKNELRKDAQAAVAAAAAAEEAADKKERTIAAAKRHESALPAGVLAKQFNGLSNLELAPCMRPPKFFRDAKLARRVVPEHVQVAEEEEVIALEAKLAAVAHQDLQAEERLIAKLEAELGDEIPIGEAGAGTTFFEALQRQRKAAERAAAVANGTLGKGPSLTLQPSTDVRRRP